MDGSENQGMLGPNHGAHARPYQKRGAGLLIGTEGVYWVAMGDSRVAVGALASPLHEIEGVKHGTQESAAGPA